MKSSFYHYQHVPRVSIHITNAAAIKNNIHRRIVNATFTGPMVFINDIISLIIYVPFVFPWFSRIHSPRFSHSLQYWTMVEYTDRPHRGHGCGFASTRVITFSIRLPFILSPIRPCTCSACQHSYDECRCKYEQS